MTFFGPPTWDNFPAMYLLLALLAFFAARALQYVLGLLIDDGEVREQAVGNASAASAAIRLRPGDIPRGEHVYLVACARNSLPSALRAGARAEGWLNENGEVVRGARPYSEMQRRYFDLANSRSAPPAAVAVELAQIVSTQLTETLRRHGLARSDLSRWSAFLATIVVGAGLIAWGIATAPTGGGWPVMLVRGMLYVLTALGFLGLGFFGLSQPLTARGQSYVAWLDEATEALRADVKSGALREHDDVVLAAALDPFSARLP